MIPADPYMSRWCRQEGHTTKTVPVHHESHLHVGVSEPSHEGMHDVKRLFNNNKCSAITKTMADCTGHCEM